jgi:mercuric ion binding protein
MKFSRILFIALGLIVAGQSFGQKKFVTTEFWVGGTCEHCKERIENVVDVKGVRMANYELSEHMLEITYKPSKISEDRIHEMLADAGHDTKKKMASDEAYGQINDCCKYRKHEHHDSDGHDDHDDHEDDDHK